MLKTIPFICSLLFTINIAYGQADVETKPVTNGTFSLGGSYHTGGLELLTLKSTLNTKVDFSHFTSSTFLQYAFNKTFNNVIQNDFFGYEIITIGKEKRFHPKIAGIYERSKVKSIDHYYVLGVGIGWNAVMKKKHKLVVMNTIAHERKDFLVDTSLNYQGIRYSIITKGENHLLDNKLIIKHNFFINPFLINAQNNYRYRFLVDFLMPLTKRISAKASFDHTNESIVDTGFKPKNTSTTFGLSIKL